MLQAGGSSDVGRAEGPRRRQRHVRFQDSHAHSKRAAETAWRSPLANLWCMALAVGLQVAVVGWLAIMVHTQRQTLVETGLEVKRLGAASAHQWRVVQGITKHLSTVVAASSGGHDAAALVAVMQHTTMAHPTTVPRQLQRTLVALGECMARLDIHSDANTHPTAGLGAVHTQPLDEYGIPRFDLQNGADCEADASENSHSFSPLRRESTLAIAMYCAATLPSIDTYLGTAAGAGGAAWIVGHALNGTSTEAARLAWQQPGQHHHCTGSASHSEEEQEWAVWQPGQRRCRRGQALVWGASPTSVHQLRERVAGAGLPVTVSDRVPVVPLSLRLHDNIASSAASDPAGLSGGLAASHAAARARFRAVAAKGELVEQCEQLRGGPQAKTLRGVMMLVRTYAGVGSKWTVPELHQDGKPRVWAMQEAWVARDLCRPALLFVEGPAGGAEPETALLHSQMRRKGGEWVLLAEGQHNGAGCRGVDVVELRHWAVYGSLDG